MIEMSGAITGLLATEGHRDEIELRRDHKEEIWDPAAPPPPPIARRRARIPIPERCDFEGNVVLPLDEDAVRRGVRRLQQARRGVDRRLLPLQLRQPRSRAAGPRAHCGGVPRRHAHFAVTRGPPPRAGVRADLHHARQCLRGAEDQRVRRAPRREARASGFGGEVVLMQSSGGVMPPQSVQRHAVSLLGSGPTGGAMGAAVAAGRSGVRDFVAADMGGTSYDTCLVRNGQPAVATNWNWRHRYYVNLPMVDVHSIGAGGGSIARVRQGALLVGPESAGSVPGPVCFSGGGIRPTVTDSDAALGYLPAKGFAGGTMVLDVEAGRAAIARDIATPLGLDVDEAAWAIQRIVNANMAQAVRRVLSQHGADPRTAVTRGLRRRRPRPRLGPGPRARDRARAGAEGLARLLRARPARLGLRDRSHARLRREALGHRRGARAHPDDGAAPTGGGRAGAGAARPGRNAGRLLRADVLRRPELRHAGAAARG